MIRVNEHIMLRSWNKNDIIPLTKIADNPWVAMQLRDGFPNPYTTDDAEKWIDVVIEIPGQQRFFCIEVEGDVAGSIGIVLKSDVYRLNAEIGYFLGEPYWGKGVMTECVKALIPYIFEHFNIRRIYAEPYARNIASRRVLEKLSFRCEAVFRKNVIKNGIMQDSCIYALLKEDWPM